MKRASSEKVTTNDSAVSSLEPKIDYRFFPRRKEEEAYIQKKRREDVINLLPGALGCCRIEKKRLYIGLLINAGKMSRNVSSFEKEVYYKEMLLDIDESDFKRAVMKAIQLKHSNPDGTEIDNDQAGAIYDMLYTPDARSHIICQQ